MKKLSRTALICVLVLLPQQVFAWGSRGHFAICEASTHLLTQPELKRNLVPLGHVLGYMCLIPDAEWKQSAAHRKSGNPGHYLNPLKSGSSLGSVNLDYTVALRNVPGKSMMDKHSALGSVWWRADQFFRRAVDQGKKKQVPTMIEEFGLMGHFVGDNGNTFHVLDDYDGFGTGHGGIHEFYETRVTGLLGPSLVSDIVAEAEKIAREKPKYLEGEDLIVSMRELALEAVKERDFILKTDPVVRPSSGKRTAKRKKAEEIIETWRPVIIRSMARSALVQAKFMDLGYLKAGRPELKRDLRHPSKLPFVEPDYLK